MRKLAEVFISLRRSFWNVGTKIKNKFVEFVTEDGGHNFYKKLVEFSWGIQLLLQYICTSRTLLYL